MNAPRSSSESAQPPGTPRMCQRWLSVLFIHWPVAPELLRPLIPSDLELDLHDGSAWLSVVPFTMAGIRHPWLPPLPGLSAMHELNLRTYVRQRDDNGVWFFSLDAAHRLLVWGARSFFHLPYLNAAISLQRSGQRIDFRSRRGHRGAPPARFEADWQIGEPLAPATPGSRDHFLTERYRLYTAHGDQLYRGRIWHRPWPLSGVRLGGLEGNLLEAAGFEQPTVDPLLHYSEGVDVRLWPLERLGQLEDPRRWDTGLPSP